MSVRVRDREKQTEKEIGLGLAGSKGCFMDSIFLQRERCIHVSEEFTSHLRVRRMFHKTSRNNGRAISKIFLFRMHLRYILVIANMLSVEEIESAYDSCKI